MQGSNFTHKIEELAQRATRPPDMPLSPAWATAPLAPALQQLQTSLQALQTARDQIVQHSKELDDVRSLAEAILWRLHRQLGTGRDGCLVTTPNGVILEADPPAAALLQVDRKQLPGRHLQEFLPEESQDTLGGLIEHALQQEDLAVREMRITPVGGEPLEAVLYADPLRGSQGQILSIRWLIQDVSQQRQAERKVQESEQRYRSLVEMLPNGVLVHRQGRILFINQAGAAIVGAASPGQLLGASLLDFVHPDSREAVRHSLQASEAGVPIGLHEERLHRPDGTEICVELASAPVTYDGAPASQIVFRDVTNRKRLQAEVIAISEMERGRIGRDLHDVLGQSLTGISFIAKSLERELQQLHLPMAAQAGEICQLAGESMRQTRALARGLTPMELRADEFVPLMKTLTMDCQHTFRMTCHFECIEGPNPVRDDNTATHLYHIAQEAITNAFKHGRARNMHLRLHFDNGTLVMTIRDDGTGFAESDRPGGIGLRIMRHRASLVGGRLSIESQPGRGATVTCAIPAVREDWNHRVPGAGYRSTAGADD